jgi:hypothetical protein
MEPYKLNILDIENIVIFNDELKKFLYDIIDTMTYFIDEEEPIIDAITINFIYNNYSFDLYNDDEMRKISIINKKTHNYEFFYENHEEILINKCKLINISADEMSDLLKQLYLCINSHYMNIHYMNNKN